MKTQTVSLKELYTKIELMKERSKEKYKKNNIPVISTLSESILNEARKLVTAGMPIDTLVYPVYYPDIHPLAEVEIKYLEITDDSSMGKPLKIFAKL